MENKQHEIRTEVIEFNRIREIYETMLSDGQNKKIRQALIKELLSKQQADGSWGVIETRKVDSDVRVHYIYFPTYYATASLIYADLSDAFGDKSVEKAALLKGLEIVCDRELMGHGFDATRQMLDALAIYRNAGLYRWMHKDSNAQSPFCDMIHERIATMKNDVNNGKTISDWNVDFREEYKREIADYDNADSPYVWYACYGSNVNKNRFMKYIDDCGDKTPPVEDRPFRFEHSIYFAKTAGNWYSGGKAFLDDTAAGEAYGRIYKITKAQFEEIKRAEGKDYSKRLHLGDIQGVPVYSFTDTQKNEPSNVPSDEYYKTILEGLAECYNGIFDMSQLNAYLIRIIFPDNTFAVAKAIKENPHFLTNTEIENITGIYGTELARSVSWLLEHKVIKQDSRSVRSGHQITDEQAYFYTVNGHCGRGLLDLILEKYSAIDMEMPLDAFAEAEEICNTEGARRYVYASRIERNHRNRVEAIRLHGYKCQACGFDFADIYGELGKNYIEVHHINPLADQDGEHIVNPATDLVCLCANCHRMVHRNQNQVLSIGDLRSILKSRKGNE